MNKMNMTNVIEELEGLCSFPFYGVYNNIFKLGNIYFEVMEDEQDGYRSSMDGVRIVESCTINTKLFHKEPLALVNVTYKSEDHSDNFFLTDDSGHVWLRYGTNNTDDYYPYFVFEYTPIHKEDYVKPDLIDAFSRSPEILFPHVFI